MRQYFYRQSFQGLCLAIFMTFSLSACEGLPRNSGPAATPVMAEKNYAAADMLIQQARSYIKADTPIKVLPLRDMEKPQDVTPLGRMIARQIGGKFVQLGYHVKESGLNGDMIMPAQVNPQNTLDAGATQRRGQYQVDAARPLQIMGHYASGREKLHVTLNLINPDQDRILAAYDYAIPMNRDIRHLNKTRAEKEKSIFGF